MSGARLGLSAHLGFVAFTCRGTHPVRSPCALGSCHTLVFLHRSHQWVCPTCSLLVFLTVNCVAFCAK